VWDAASGQQLRDLTGHTGAVWPVAWSPDGSQLASAGIDGRGQIWDPAQEAALGTFIPLADGWAVPGGDGFSYKYAGTVNGEFWWAVGLCPFPPGELDPYYPQLRRLPAGTPLTEFALETRKTGG
jgi:WD40 repeat protein